MTKERVRERKGSSSLGPNRSRRTDPSVNKTSARGLKPSVPPSSTRLIQRGGVRGRGGGKGGGKATCHHGRRPGVASIGTPQCERHTASYCFEVYRWGGAKRGGAKTLASLLFRLRCFAMLPSERSRLGRHFPATCHKQQRLRRVFALLF